MKFSTQFSIFGTRPLPGYTTKLAILSLDMAFALLSITVALLLVGRFDFERISLLFGWAPLALLCLRSLAFYSFRTYLFIVRYIGERDYVNVFYAIALASAAFLFLLTVFPSPIPRKEVLPIVLVDFFILLFLSGGFRVFLRLLFDQRKMHATSRLNTVIFGAGEMGAMIDRVLKQNTNHHYRVVAFFDDNPSIHLKFLNGVRVYNPKKSFHHIIDKYDVKNVIIGISKMEEARRLDFLDACLAKKIEVLKLPPTEQWLDNRLNMGQLQKIKFEDLLSRPPIQLDQAAINSSVNGKTVLVSGCAGSIGSEIVRQLLRYEPRLLLGIDQAETPLVELGLSLGKWIDAGVFVPRIGDVRDAKAMERLFAQYQPAYVFHAAAYKHVPIMEAFPAEAIRTNVGGSRIMADLSVKYGAQKFVMISTDKAVNPSNVMGASKRLAELYIQALSQQEGLRTHFITTRFGNVLGSNGSVIPIFKRQIEARQPVTVTHPEVTRYFMTIPEACQLVLEAGAMGKGGEIFIFDMGEPVKIVDLATRMIQLAGLIPNQDVKIVFSGLRPGEKLYEELLDTGEGLIPTHHPKIKKAEVRSNDYSRVNQEIYTLVQLANTGAKAAEIVAKMKALVPEFTSMNSEFEALDEAQKAKAKG